MAVVAGRSTQSLDRNETMKLRLHLIAVLVSLAGCAAAAQPLPVDPLPADARALDTCSRLKILQRPAPTYPRAAVASRQEGWVHLQLDLGPEGIPMNVRVVASSPKGVFDNVAISAATGYRFSESEARSCGMLFQYQLKD